MFVKLENAKIDVDREFLITHFDYVERWYESELTQNREQLNLDGFLINDFNNLVELIQARWPEIQSLSFQSKNLVPFAHLYIAQPRPTICRRACKHD